MRKYLIFALASFAAGVLCLMQAPHAQLGMTGIGGGGFGGAAGYVGPGDIATFNLWAGLRCYSAAYTGSVADVYAPADASHTLVTCSAGGILNETLQPLATTCAVSCTVKTLYDQSGANGCTGSPCDLNDASFAVLRPAFTLNCIGSKPCMTFSASTENQLKNTAYAQAQPMSGSFVAIRTADFTTRQAVMFPNNLVGFDNVANQLIFYFGAGSGILPAANDNVWHAINFVGDGASSIANVDGTDTSTANIGTGGATGFYLSCNTSANASCIHGRVVEAGAVGGSLSGGNRTALASNQAAYWGY